ncbi:3'(2'),5'-bisphosphate nucleotidase CysQ [Granulosicoccaceae sp. 1_MG-2023]|nr:3'(2'),5'-bisphosphate nucleotidase CysQ [Granulosicoccaceae sp. 1_MG-2023]
MPDEQERPGPLTPELAEFYTGVALSQARMAGERILQVYENGYDVYTKEDHTPLTTADLAANRSIVDGLRRLVPNIPVLSEESCSVPFTERTDWNRYWLVDPLDGTREFIKRNGEFSVNIALIENGEPLIGVVYGPVMDVAYYAARGFGAWKQTGQNPPKRIHARRAPDGRVTVARSRSPVTGPNMQTFLSKLGEHDEIAMGSALKSCLVAEGVADIYARLGPTSEWDTAAAQCIVAEAGGRITDIRLRELRYNTRESLLNPHFIVVGDARGRDWAAYLPPDLSEFPA